MYKRVIVPLDGSEFAEAVLPFLRTIAGPLDMEVVLVRVVEPRPMSVYPDPAQTLILELEGRREDAAEYLAPIAVDLRSAGVSVTAVVRCGHPAAEILALARERQADLIAMATHARRGFEQFVFGSVAESLLRKAAIPMLLLKPQDRGAELVKPVATERCGSAS